MKKNMGKGDRDWDSVIMTNQGSSPSEAHV